LEKVNYGNNTLEIGQKIKKLVEEQNFFKMEIVMMELGKKTCLMEKEE
jgi:endonuclease III